MKQLQTLRIILGILVFAGASRLAVAQSPAPGFTPGETAVITLKSGDKFEGKVLRDAPDSVEIEYRLTPKILDKKIILKSDIASVTKRRPSETEFAERGLAKLLPTPDLKDASYYESTIQDQLRTFIAKHPGTPEAAEVEKIISAFVEEKSKVLSGQLKMEGEWLPAATVKRDTYNIEAYRQLLNMRAKAAENTDTRYLEALRAFEKLQMDYRVSPFFLKAVPEALDYLKKLDIQITEMIKEAPILIKRRDDGVKQLPPNEQPMARKAVEAEKHAYEDIVRKQIAEKVKWRDINKLDDKGNLQYIQATIAKERAELSALDIPALQADSEILVSVIHALADKNIADAGAALDKAAKLPNQSYRLLVQSFTKELGALREQAKKEQKAASGAASGADGGKAGDSAGSNPVAEAMKKLQEEKKKKAAEMAAEAKAKAAAAEAAPAAVVETPATLMEKLNEYLLPVGGGLVVVIALAWLMGKRKKAKADEE